MHWTTTYPNFSFLGQKLWPLDSKRFISETPFARPLSPGEMVQTPELSHISTDRDKIWCVKAPKVDIDSYQISSGLVEKPLSYEAFSFYYKIVILLHFIVKKKMTFLTYCLNIQFFLLIPPKYFFTDH